MSELHQPVWLREEEAPPLPNGWCYLPTEEACVQLKPGKLFENKTVAPEGAVPVINQSQDGIIGYHDEEPGVVASRANPVVTFANHTCAMRLMTEPFSCIQNVFPKIGKEGVTDTKYFYYASQGRVSISDYKGHHPVFRKTLIPIPPLTTQRRIAGILSAYDDLIENILRRIKILEEMAQSLYREWFVHFRFPGYESVEMVDSPLGMIPEGWQKVPFEDVLVSMTGGDWGEEVATETENHEVLVVRGTDFDELRYGSALRAPARFIKKSSFATRGLKEGDVIVENSVNAKSRPSGTPLLIDRHALARLNTDAIAASFCKVFRFANPSLAPIAFLHLLHLREDNRIEYYQNVAANGIANFQGKRFATEEYLILPSSDALRNDLLAKIASLLDGVGVLASKIANLRQTRDLLLPKLLSTE